MRNLLKTRRLLTIVYTALAIIAGAVYLFTGAPSFAAAAEDTTAAVRGELIVVYESGKQDAEDRTQELLEGTLPVKSAEPVTEAVAGEGPGVLVKLEDPDALTQAAKSLERQPDVAYVQPNFRYRMMDAPSDPFWEESYQLKPWDPAFQSSCGANVTGAWELMGGLRKNSLQNSDPPVTIAVLDSGCQVTHEDLRDVVDTAHAYNAVTHQAGADQIADGSSHGTHVCGIAAGAADNGLGITGAAGNYASILPINVFEGMWADTADLVTAYSYLEELMDKGEIRGLHVINMSLGGYGEKDENDIALEESIKRMREKDVLTVCAGGNGDDENGIAYKDNPAYPGDFEACMCVTSLDSDGTNSSFSDYNMEKDISAPGSFILSTMTDEKGTKGDGPDCKYGYLSGTSMASPLVAGIAALLWADNDQLSADQVFESITQSALPVNPATFSHEGDTGSAGAIDAAGAVQYARVHFDQERKNLKDAVVTPETESFVYNGAEQTPQLQVSYGGVTLKEKEDYIVSYWNCTLAGTATYTVTGIRDYIGSVTGEYTIAPADLNDAEVVMDPVSYQYDGLSHFPALHVTMDGRSLKWGQDFTVTASTDGIRPGTHPILLNGKGNYGGSKQISYEIIGESSSSEEPLPAPTARIRKGSQVQYQKALYQVTSAAASGKAGTLRLVRAADKKTFTLPAAVKLSDGKTYRITGIQSKAFRKSRARTILLKSRFLKKAAVKGCLRGSKVKTIKVRVSTGKQNKTYKKKYRKYFTKKNVGRKVTLQ